MADDPVRPTRSEPRIVHESGNDDVADLLTKLDLGASRPVVVVSGGAADLDAAVKPRLRRLLTGGVGRAAAQVGALIVDRGTRAGVMELIGAAVDELGHRSPLLGVAPAALVDVDGTGSSGRVPLDLNHSHILLTSGEAWGDELDTMTHPR